MGVSSKNNILKSISFRICVYPSGFNKSYFTAHCLELDIFGQDKTLQGAIGQLLELIESHLSICAETGAQTNFFAPKSVWRKYELARKSKRKVSDELIDRIIDAANKRLGYVSPIHIDSIAGPQKVIDEVMEECRRATV